MGVAQLAGAVAFAVPAAIREGPAVALLVSLAVAAIFGAWMYLLVYRRADPQATRASGVRGLPLRVAFMFLALAAIAAITGNFALPAGILAGNGAALLVADRRLRERG